MRYILGIDIGTTAIKGAVIGEDGKIYGTKTSEYPLTTLPTGEVEADLQLYINAFTQSIKGAVEDAKVDVADIKCVGFSSTAETCVFLDKYNEPLCKVIAWMDTRATKEAEYLTAHFDKKDIINKVGFDGIYAIHPVSKILAVKNKNPEIFEKTRFSATEVKSRLHETAYLNPELTIRFEDKRGAEVEDITYHEPDGIIGFIKDLNHSAEVLHDPVYLKGEADGIQVEVAFQFTNEFRENVLGFCNNIYNSEGGTHLTGFKTQFTNVINTYARELNILKEKDANFTGADVRNGMTAVVSIKHPDPRFEGQTKTKLDNQDAAKAVAKVTGEEIVRFFDRNLETLKSIIGCAEKAAKIRKTEEKAKTNMLTKQKFSFDSNGKLANCESRDPSKCEIFIVEGDSAGGSAKTARNRMYQAILPIRGKILNVEKASIDKVLANAEIKTMINAFGCGFSEGYGNDFDITKLRYDKIIIMADADVDGAHISTLLLTLFYRFMPDLIFEGHVYIAMPPLYKAMPSKGEEKYLYDDKALEKYRKTHKGPFTLQRYKGLGEMDAEQLWETTLDPERRLLKLVEIEDARMASEMTELLMGTDVPPRKAFIYDHATDAELDI